MTEETFLKACHLDSEIRSLEEEKEHWLNAFNHIVRGIENTPNLHMSKEICEIVENAKSKIEILAEIRIKTAKNRFEDL